MQGASDGVGALSTPRASALALQTLRDMTNIRAVVTEMQQTVRPAAEFGVPPVTAPLSATLQDGLADLNYRVAALRTVMNSSSAWGGQLLSPAGPSEDLKTLRSQAQRLQRETGSQQQLLLILEEQEGGSVERTREVFEMMDVNGDGRVSEEEFLRGATQLLGLNKEKNAQASTSSAPSTRSSTARRTGSASRSRASSPRAAGWGSSTSPTSTCRRAAAAARSRGGTAGGGAAPAPIARTAARRCRRPRSSRRSRARRSALRWRQCCSPARMRTRGGD